MKKDPVTQLIGARQKLAQRERQLKAARKLLRAIVMQQGVVEISSFDVRMADLGELVITHHENTVSYSWRKVE